MELAILLPLISGLACAEVPAAVPVVAAEDPEAAPVDAAAPEGLLLPELLLQFAEIMLMLLTCSVPLPLSMPVTETVWPICWVNCGLELLSPCSVQLLPLLSVRLKLPEEPCRQPVTEVV